MSASEEEASSSLSLESLPSDVLNEILVRLDHGSLDRVLVRTRLQSRSIMCFLKISLGIRVSIFQFPSRHK